MAYTNHSRYSPTIYCVIAAVVHLVTRYLRLKAAVSILSWGTVERNLESTVLVIVILEARA